MKLKSVPEDFQVEEVAEFPAAGGRFALYRLTKRSLGTPEAVAAVARRWRVPFDRISYGGLKDRHALTQQYVTIFGGPRRDLTQTNLQLKYLGQSGRPFTPAEITGNRFRVVLRDLAERDLDETKETLAAIERDGVPNYFDEQRFGSVGESGEFVARAWCAGDYDRALWLALAEPNAHDRPRDREEKGLLRANWGDWAACRRASRGTPREPVFAQLERQPGDLRRAFARISPHQRGLYLAAFQSYLWNRLLETVLRELLPVDRLSHVPLDRWRVPFFKQLEDPERAVLQTVELPLPSARLHLADGPTRALVERVLTEEGLQLRELRVKYPRDSFFARGERAAISRVKALSYSPESDELHPPRRKLALRFELDRGAYATTLIKRLTIKTAR